MKNQVLNEKLIPLLKGGNIRISTASGELDLSKLRGTAQGGETVYETPLARVTVSVFDKGGETAYRGVTIECREDLTLYRLDFLTDFSQTPREFVAYRSFINAPAAAFVRYDGMGYYTGVENPFFSMTIEGSEVCLSFEPSLILKKGEVYDAEPQFLGVCEFMGETVRETEPLNIDSVARGIKRGRFFNPCGEIPLDVGEIEAMRRYVAEYYDVIRKQFDNIFYCFFYPKKQRPSTESEVQDYLSLVDRFAQMSGDIMAFNPHVGTTVPTNEKPYWELAPEGSAAERILHYAQNKGLRCGYYMGAGCLVDGGNTGLLPFMPEEKAWKKRDREGSIAGENCLACDEYLEWWYTVQKNTIEKYDLAYWAWDPGPGNGNDCYAENHGHLPGKGEYKGWRNSQKLLKRIKETFPDLFLMSFYGRKEYGHWGFRYFSQHEVYWENTALYGATLYNDLHEDRMNADGIRLQNQWCMNFRFMPAHIGHGLVPRMGEMWFTPEIDRAYDFGGFRYALLSAIACCGSATHCTIPDKLENVPGLVEFYKKWIKWAKDNYRYCAFTRPIGDRVSSEIVDGFARIDRDSGQIFLFNSTPKILNKKLPLDKKLGLDTQESFYLKILYCDNTDLEDRDVQFGGVYRMGDVLDITVPPFTAVVLELNKTERESIRELPRHTHTIDVFKTALGKRFEYPRHRGYEKVTLTAHAVFLPELKEALDRAHIENEEYLLKKIPEWHKAGIPFPFTGTLPHRLVMFIPFDEFKLPGKLRLYINGKEIPIEIFTLKNIPYRKVPVYHYAFIEDAVKWGEDNTIKLKIEDLAPDSFLGLHVDYPDVCEGMRTEEIVFPEHPIPSNLHADPSLVIDSFTITPDTLTRDAEQFTVRVKTEVPAKKIEGVYYLHPSISLMNELQYVPERKIWQASSDSGKRSWNLFANTTITAWIMAKDGGVGPRAQCKVYWNFPKQN